MSELLAKLNKRRAVVEEDGDHFENAPKQDSTTTPPPAGGSSSSAAPVQKGAAPVISKSGTTDFLSAIHRRRATVDGDGETFESKPTAMTADCGHEATTPVGEGGADAHPAIDRQRASVDDSIQKFESAAKKAECSHDGHATKSPSSQAEAAGDRGAPTEPAPAPAPAERAAPEEPAAPLEAPKPAEAEAPKPVEEPPAPEELEEPEEPPARPEPPKPAEAPAPAEATTALPTPTRACGLHPGPDADGEPAAAASDPEDAPEGADGLEAGDAGAGRGEYRSTVQVHGKRINWLIGLGSGPLPEALESPQFALGGYAAVHLCLRPGAGREGGCVLSLHGDSPRPAGIRVGLFAGKGWAKRSLTEWRDGCPLEEKFDINIAGRSSILCGLVYQD